MATETQELSNIEDFIKRLTKVKKDLAILYEEIANDGVEDDGNLSSIHNAILNVQCAIKHMEKQL